MASGTGFWGSSDSSDDDSISLTSTVSSERQDEYPLEAILAERTVDGVTEYLVKWEGYPEYRCTWEQKNSFQDEQTLLDWGDQKMRISRGHAKPFDTDAWERDMEDLLGATAKRQALRRKKKISLGLPVADLPSDFEASTDDSSSDASNETDGPDYETEATSPAWTPKEESTLLEALKRLKAPRWNGILKLYGSSGIVNQNLKDRTETGLQKKAIALKNTFDASGKNFPILAPLDNSSEGPSDLRNINIPTASGKPSVQSRTVRGEAAFLDDDSLLAMGNAVIQTIEKPQTSKETSQNPRKRDHQIAQTRKKPEKPRIRVPVRTTNVLQSRSAPAPSRALVTTKASTTPTAVFPQRPSHPNPPSAKTEQRPTQLGTVGRGPARARLPVTNNTNTGINVLGNWGAEPTKRRKSRYEMMTVQDRETKPPKTFKRFSTQRKYDKAGRYERTPDINSLTFVSRKDGKPLPKPPTAITPKPAQQTPFQMLQRRVSQHQDELPSMPDDNSRPEREQTPPTKTSMSSSKPPPVFDSKQEEESKTANAPAAANAPLRRASLPFEAYVERHSRGLAQSCTAPVAMMSSVQKQKTDKASFEQQDFLPSPVELPEEKEDQTESSDAPGKQMSGSHGKGRRNSETAAPEQPGTVRAPSHNKPLHHTESRSGPQPNDIMVYAAPTTSTISSLQPRGDGYALFPLETLPASRTTMAQLKNLDVIAEILTGSEGDSTGTVIFRGLPDFSLKQLFLTIRVPPKQMHVWCKNMLTAGEYATYFHVGETLQACSYV